MAEEVTGWRSLGQELGRGWLENVHADDRERCAQTVDAALRQRRMLRDADRRKDEFLP